MDTFVLLLPGDMLLEKSVEGVLGYRGVRFDKTMKKWYVLHGAGMLAGIGCFATALEAARARRDYMEGVKKRDDTNEKRLMQGFPKRGDRVQVDWENKLYWANVIGQQSFGGQLNVWYEDGSSEAGIDLHRVKFIQNRQVEEALPGDQHLERTIDAPCFVGVKPEDGMWKVMCCP